MAIVKLDGYRCERCNHEWLPRDRQGIQTPTVCPKCKSPYWNAPRKPKPEKAVAKAEKGKAGKP